MTDAPRPDFISRQVEETRYYYLDLEPAPREDFTVVCGGCERCGADYEINRTGFRFYGVEYVAEGEGELRLKGKTYHLRPGSVFAYGPRVPQRIRTDPDRRMVKYFVDFAGREAGRWLSDSVLGEWKVVHVMAPNRIFDLFEELHRTAIRESRYASRICAELVKLLLLRISDLAVPGRAPSPRSLVDYERARRFMEEQGLRIQSLQEAARKMGTTPHQLCRLFKRYADLSPYQLLTRLKMNRAAELLQMPGVLVKEVADELGFSDSYHFSRTFKKVYGYAPERFIHRTRR